MAEEEESGQDGYTKDGTVDLKGNPILRSKRGGWTACSFVVVYEVFERMAYNGISSNLIIYLTNKLHQGTVKSANNVTNWAGTVWMTPILGAYVADALLGRYWTFLIASAIYLMGMSLLTLAVSVNGLKPPHCVDKNPANCEKANTVQLAVFFGGLYTLAVGTGGTKPNISTIGADQFDEFDPKEKAQKLSFFNWHKKPTGSPFTKMAKVIVAALRKWRVPVPADPKQPYELDLQEYANKGKYRIDSTPSLRFLNRACVKTDSTSPWMLCPVTQVEETKQILRMIPILIATLRSKHNDCTKRYRLKVAKDHGLDVTGGQVPLSIFILLPQFILMGTADAFLEVAKIEFFYDQAPESMKSLGTSYSMTTLGAGNFISSFLLSTVSRVTKENGHHGWIQNNLNASHLDYYYAFFAILNCFNFIFFLVVIKFYVYKAEVSYSLRLLKEELGASNHRVTDQETATI
ncbi:Protein NRT1/PTR FAMILY 5.3 [Abeliophyllum distichum]|uniref:Protein NRT1/PTR FAMILY 5.3 n=1 Tax=Abeliophyllum distichum TaxID=126358 RepID=A0ABD1Q391_9LAMI